MNHNIHNRAIVEAEFCGHRHVVETAETVLHPIRLELESIHPCPFYVPNSIIHYEFRLRNASNIPVSGARFVNTIQENCEYIPGSFRINGVPTHVQMNGNTLVHCFREICPQENLLICFDVRVRPFAAPCFPVPPCACQHGCQNNGFQCSCQQPVCQSCQNGFQGNGFQTNVVHGSWL